MKIDNSGAEQKTDTHLEHQLASILAKVPPMFKLPPPKGRCPHTGQTRTGLLELISPCERNNFQPPIRAAGIYKKAHKHAQRGSWTVVAEPLFRYLLEEAAKSAETFLETSKARQAKAA